MLRPLPLTEARRVILQARYDKAEEVYDLLATGRAVEQFVDQNGEQVKYTKATLSGLEAYMRLLYNQLNPCFAMQNAPKPLGFIF